MSDVQQPETPEKYPPIFRFKPGAVKWACILAVVAEVELLTSLGLARAHLVRLYSNPSDAFGMVVLCAGWPVAFLLAMGMCYVIGTYNAGMTESGATPKPPFQLGGFWKSIRSVCPPRFRWLIPATPEDTISATLVLWPLLWCVVIIYVDIGAITGLRPVS